MYLSILFISAPILAANNRGETDGNGQTLQKVNTSDDTRSVLSGYSIKRSMRDNMQMAGAPVWRYTMDDFDDNIPAGYKYQNQEGVLVPTMLEATPTDPSDFVDTLLFGYMTAAKGTYNKYATKRKGQVSVSPALSTTPWTGDVAFSQGLKASQSDETKKADGKGPDLALFTCERHYTRYQFTVTVNLGNLKGKKNATEAVQHLIESLRSLQVGGNHASNASEIIPDVLAWRFHKVPGTGNLYLGAGLNHEPGEAIDLSALKKRAVTHGFVVNIAGTPEKSIDQGINEILKDALEVVGLS